METRPGSAVEVRETEDGPHLYGTLIQEGRAARRRREVFAPGSVEWPAEGVGILTRHHGAPEVRAVPTREPDGRITLRARATDAIREAVAAGRRYMSVEFHALRERRTEGGIREVLRALVPDVVLVPDPEYAQTGVEVRQAEGDRIIVAGPPAGGKSNWIREQLAIDPEWLVLDFGRLAVALMGHRRDPETGRYPVRESGDPRLAFVGLFFARMVQEARERGLKAFVTTTDPSKIEELSRLAGAARVQRIDPGREVVRARLEVLYEGEEVPGECGKAVSRWYGSLSGLSRRRRALIAGAA